MKKHTFTIIAVVLVTLILLAMFGSRSQNGTIKDFADNAVIVALDDGKTVVRIEDYHAYITADKDFAVGDRVKIKHAFFNDMDIVGIYLIND